MEQYNQPVPQPLGELEMQQALNTQMLIEGARIAGMYLDEGQTGDDLDIDMVLQDLQAVIGSDY